MNLNDRLSRILGVPLSVIENNDKEALAKLLVGEDRCNAKSVIISEIQDLLNEIAEIYHFRALPIIFLMPRTTNRLFEERKDKNENSL